MGKDIQKKTRGSWYYGWVRYSYLDYNGESREMTRTTDWDYATISLAHREAEKLAGALAAPTPLFKWERRYSRKPAPSRVTILEVGASKAP